MDGGLRARAPDVLETARLRGERLRPEHADLLHAALYADPRVMATLGGRTYELPETRAAVASGAEHWARHGFGTFVFSARADGRLVGRGGLHAYRIDEGEVAALLYHLAADAWGRGLATEIAAALLRLGFEVLGLPAIFSWTTPGNLASRRVMEKCGLVHVRDGVFAGLPHAVYRIDVDAWRARQRDRPA